MATIGTTTQTLTLNTPALTFNLHGTPWVLITRNGNSVGLQIAFQGSVDGENWFPLAAVRADNYLPDTGTLTVGDGAFESWYIQTLPWNFLQVENVAFDFTSPGVPFTLVELSDAPPLLVPPLQSTLANVTNLSVAGTTTGAAGGDRDQHADRRGERHGPQAGLDHDGRHGLDRLHDERHREEPEGHRPAGILRKE